MPLFDDVDLEHWLKSPEWTDAHDCFRDENQESKKSYGDLYRDGDLPFWLYARTCIEEEIQCREDRNQKESVSSNSSQPPINRIPRFILARIFVHLRDLYIPDETSRALSYGYTGNPHAWLYVTLICRHWRNTTYCCASLWTWINLPCNYDREILRSLLILSNKEPLRVTWDSSVNSAVGEPTTCTIREVGELAILLDLVLDERERVEVLMMNIASTKVFRIVPWRELCSRPPWIRLRRLVLRGTKDDDVRTGRRKEARVVPALTEAIFPQLQELALDGMHPRWDGTRLPALVRLEINNIDSVLGGFGNATVQLIYGAEASGDPYFCRFLEQCTELRLLKINNTAVLHPRMRSSSC